MIPSKNILFEAIRRRWDEQAVGSHVTGGIRDVGMTERTARPYAVLECLEDAPFQFTNCSRYDKVTFMITIVGNTPEQVGKLAGVVDSVIQSAPLGLQGEGAHLVDCKAAPNKYADWRGYPSALLGYEALIRRDRKKMTPAIAG